jgi:hypothetical protein
MTRVIYNRLAYIVACLPATGKTLAESLGVSRSGLQVWVRRLRANGIVDYGAMRHRDGRVYVKGNGRSFAYARKAHESKCVERFCIAWHALERRCTVDDVAKAAGIGRRAASEIVREMHSYKLARIASWVLCGQTLTPVYDRLELPDVPRPPPKTSRQSSREYRERRSATCQDTWAAKAYGGQR